MPEGEDVSPPLQRVLSGPFRGGEWFGWVVVPGDRSYWTLDRASLTNGKRLTVFDECFRAAPRPPEGAAQQKAGPFEDRLSSFCGKAYFLAALVLVG